MRIKTILFAPVFILAIVLAIALSIYVHLSSSAGRALNAAEFLRFSQVILFSTAFHQDEGGGARALELSKQALTPHSSNHAVILNGRSYLIPLPKYAVIQNESEGRSYFVAFATSDEIQDYLYRQLSEAGWQHVDQMGAAHFFLSPAAGMTVIQRFHLTTGISEFHISIRERQP